MVHDAWVTPSHLPSGFWKKPLKRLRGLLKHLRDEYPHPNRQLHFDDLLILLLFAFFKPSLDTLRSVQRATQSSRVQKRLGVGPTGLSTLSEAASTFDPEKVYPLLRALARKAHATDAHAVIPGLPRDFSVVIQDASLWQALPSMAWALWLDPKHRGFKTHLQLDLRRGVPVRAKVSPAQEDDRCFLRETLQPRTLYLLDRGYQDFQLLSQILAINSSFLMPLRSNNRFQVLEDRPLSQAAREVGVIGDARVQLGSPTSARRMREPLRLIHLRRWVPPSQARCPKRQRGKHKAPPTDEPQLQEMLLITDRTDLPAESLVLLYQHRWKIEIFFRWLKSTLRCRRLFFHSQHGVTLQIYMALIASLLIVLWAGRVPNKALLEILELYLQGWATWDEVRAQVAQLKKTS